MRSKNKQLEYDDIGLSVNNNFIEPPDDVVDEIKEVLLRSTLQDIQINEQFNNIKNIIERTKDNLWILNQLEKKIFT